MGNLNQLAMYHLGRADLLPNSKNLQLSVLPTLRAASAFKELEFMESLEALTGAAGSPGLDLDTAVQLALEKEAE